MICIYIKGKAKIKLGREGRHVDTNSRKLFTAVLESIFKKLDWKNKEIRINGEYLSHFWFADDSLIFSNSPEELENMLKGLAEASVNVGLKINLEKTMVMFNSFASKKNIIYNNAQIKEVQNYVYLGQ